MRFLHKVKETFIAVLAVNLLVWSLILFKVIPFNASIMIGFSISSLLLIVGQSLFIIGAEDSIMQMGQKIGGSIDKIKNIFLIFLIGFLLGSTATLAEPDIMFFVESLIGFCPTLPQIAIMLGLAFSIGLFVILGLIQLIKHIKLKYIFTIFYTLSIVLCLIFSNSTFGLAFDASGVTTGPITVPLVMAFGVGISSILPKNQNGGGGFGMVGIVSIAPVLLMSFFGLLGVADVPAIQETELTFIQILANSFSKSFIALLPIIIIFIVLNFCVLKLTLKKLIKIFVSLIICYLGLVIFLTSINYGFAPMGQYLGECFGEIVTNGGQIILILLILIILGAILVFTEPAILILAEQVNTASNGQIKKHSVFIALIVGISIALLLAGIKTIFAIPSYYLLIPIVIASLLLSYFIPEKFVGIAFDSGGVASGTMAVTFVFPIFLGIAEKLGISILSYAFGTIALIATVPILCIEILGLISKIKAKEKNNDR